MRRHLTYSNVAATLALVLALSVTPAGAHVTSKFGHLWNKHLTKKIAWEVVSVTDDVGPSGNDYYGATIIPIPCPAGKEVLGGGHNQGTVSTNFVVDQSRPADDNLGWVLRVHNQETYSVNVTGYAVCANLK